MSNYIKAYIKEFLVQFALIIPLSLALGIVGIVVKILALFAVHIVAPIYRYHSKRAKNVILGIQSQK